MVRRFIIMLVILLFTIPSIFSEVDIDATLSGAIIASKVGEADITSSGLASGNLTIKSTGQKNVKSQLTLDFFSMRNMGVLSISKAWIKFRYPLFRVTLGKNRITWGEGMAFNAGDVIFDDYIAPGSEAEAADLTADELRSLNRTMAEIIFPLGRFTYAEAIYLPYDFPLYYSMPSVAPDYQTPLNYYQHSYGGRFVTRFLGVKLESGYIYNGNSELHKPYLSLNGHFIVDYQLSASANIVHGDTDFDQWKESIKITGGEFYMFELENDKTLALRWEAQIKPYGDWETDALLIYPEISFIPNDEIALFFRAIINPLEVDAKGTLGLNWKTYQGFSIGSFLSVSHVDGVDPNLSLSVVVTHKF